MSNRTLTLNNDTSASYPARASVSRFRYAWFYPKWPAVWTLSLVVCGFLILKVSLWFLFLLLPILSLNFLYWLRIKEFFAHGDANPGMVIQINPTVVAVTTDLTHGVGSYPAIKVFRTRLLRMMGEKPQVGTRLPTVALYSRSPDKSSRHWADFNPRPLECATGDQQLLNRVMVAFSEGEWYRLEAAVQRLPSYQPGLYRLAAWPKTAIISDQITPEKFWQVIENTKANSQPEQLEQFKRELQQLSLSELIGFERYFMELKFAAYNWDIWLAAWVSQGGMCSDDSFADFCSWLIAQGRAVYETALRDPDALVDEIRRTDNPRFEFFGYVPSQIYAERAGRRLPDNDLHHPQEPSGGEWLRPELKDQTGSKLLNRCVVFNKMGDEEFSAIAKRFPRIWELCLQRNIIATGDRVQSTWPSHLPTIEQVVATIDPKLAETDFGAYLKAVADAARQAYKKKE